jgi:hypothetical protein
MQASSAPSSPRTFSFVKTAGAVPGKASVLRKIARSYALRERDFLVICPTIWFLEAMIASGKQGGSFLKYVMGIEWDCERNQHLLA